MDLKKYAKYLGRELYQLIDDIEKGLGREVEELPPLRIIPTGARFIVEEGGIKKEYIKLKDNKYHLLGGGGEAGTAREIEIRKTDTHIQWKYTDSEEWIDLIAIEELKGETGATGPAGEPGEGVPEGGTTGQVLKKASDNDYDTEWADESGGGAIGEIKWVDFVSASDVVYQTSDTTISVTLPSEIEEGDLILLFVMHRSDLSAISGYNLVISDYAYTGSYNHSLSIYKKTAVSGDASSNIIINQATAVRFGVQALVFRSRTGGQLDVLKSESVVQLVDEPMMSKKLYADGITEMAVIASTFVYSSTTGDTTINFPDGYINTTPITYPQNRLAIAYRNAIFFGGISGGVIIETPDNQDTYSVHITLIIGHTI